MDQIKIIDDLATVSQINQEARVMGIEMEERMIKEMTAKIEEDDSLTTYCFKRISWGVCSFFRTIDSFLDNFGNRFEDFVKYSKSYDQEHPELLYEALFDY